MKKFLAGALAAALVLSNSVPVFADLENFTVKEQGEVEYNMTAGKPELTMNVILPGDMNIAMNPYGLRFYILKESEAYTENGIVSVAYPIQNFETDYGIYLDAKAVTVNSGTKWVVSTEPVEPGVKGANMSFTASASPEGITQYSNEFRAATSAEKQGNLPLDSTVPYNKKTGNPSGYTAQRKLAYIPASVDGVEPGITYVGFTGILAGDSEEKRVKWKDDDSIIVRLVLKITPAPKNLGTAPEVPPDP